MRSAVVLGIGPPVSPSVLSGSCQNRIRAAPSSRASLRTAIAGSSRLPKGNRRLSGLRTASGGKPQGAIAGDNDPAIIAPLPPSGGSAGRRDGGDGSACPDLRSGLPAARAASCEAVAGSGSYPAYPPVVGDDRGGMRLLTAQVFGSGVSPGRLSSDGRLYSPTGRAGHEAGHIRSRKSDSFL